MAIDVHAHYIPQSLIAAARSRGADMGVRVVDNVGTTPALEFSYGFKVRPFFPKLIETAAERIAWLDSQRLDRQFVATWPDIYGYGLPRENCAAWHRVLNDTLADWCDANASRMSFVASVPLPNADDAATELERAARLGAVAVMVSANIEGRTSASCRSIRCGTGVQLQMPVIIHPMASAPFLACGQVRVDAERAIHFRYDARRRLAIFSGVLDRFPTLTLVFSHGGGAYPYLAGRFDIMHARMDKRRKPMSRRNRLRPTCPRMVYDTIVHAPKPSAVPRRSGRPGPSRTRHRLFVSSSRS